MQTVVGCCQEEINWVRYGAVFKKERKEAGKKRTPYSKNEEKKVLGDSMRLPLED